MAAASNGGDGGRGATMAGVPAEDDLAAWDRIADDYARMAGGDDDLVLRRFAPFLWRHLGEDLNGLRVLDLGCGHGWLAEACRRRGAEVVGVDGSTRLLGMAREKYPAVEFAWADLTRGLPDKVTSRSFDRIVAHMVLMDLPDLAPLAASLRRVLVPGGVFVATLLHPSFFLQPPVDDPEHGERYRKVKGYLRHEAWWVDTFGGHRHYHRPLEFYVRWLAAAGMTVVDLHEPPVPIPKPREEWTEYDRWLSSVPTMLGLAATPLVSPAAAAALGTSAVPLAAGAAAGAVAGYEAVPEEGRPTGSGAAGPLAGASWLPEALRPHAGLLLVLLGLVLAAVGGSILLASGDGGGPATTTTTTTTTVPTTTTTLSTTTSSTTSSTTTTTRPRVTTTTAAPAPALVTAPTTTAPPTTTTTLPPTTVAPTTTTAVTLPPSTPPPTAAP